MLPLLYTETKWSFFLFFFFWKIIMLKEEGIFFIYTIDFNYICTHSSAKFLEIIIVMLTSATNYHPDMWVNIAEYRIGWLIRVLILQFRQFRVFFKKKNSNRFREICFLFVVIAVGFCWHLQRKEKIFDVHVDESMA